MVADHADERSSDAAPGRPRRPSSRLLDDYLARAEAVVAAESRYRAIALIESEPHPGHPKDKAPARRAAAKTLNAAFDALAEAAAELKASRAALLAQAESDGLAGASLLTADAAFVAAEGRIAGYVAARTYDQLREVAGAPPQSST
jgi:hypothetical protein